MNLKNYLHKNSKLKKRIHRFIMHPVKTRPYWWIRILQPIYIKKGKGAGKYIQVQKKNRKWGGNLSQCPKRPSPLPPIPVR